MCLLNCCKKRKDAMDLPRKVTFQRPYNVFRFSTQLLPQISFQLHSTNKDLLLRFFKNIFPIIRRKCYLWKCVVFFLWSFWLPYSVQVSNPKGPFNNYVDKMRGRGSKKCLFCQVYKNCQHKGGGGSKMAKFCPRSC